VGVAVVVVVVFPAVVVVVVVVVVGFFVTEFNLGKSAAGVVLSKFGLCVVVNSEIHSKCFDSRSRNDFSHFARLDMSSHPPGEHREMIVFSGCAKIVASSP
jgi:hypothetical protein